MIRGFQKISLKQYKKDNLDISYYEEYLLPKRSTRNSAGYDFYALEDYIIKSGQVVNIPTGIKVYMLEDEVLYLFIRSSLGCKHNISLCTKVSVVDADYYNNPNNEGHIWAYLKNEGDRDFVLNKGDHYMQGVFSKFLKIDDDKVTEFRVAGSGSTNKGGN